jgi:glycosyl transferase family 25
MHYARQGIITPEMEYVAIRENLNRAAYLENLRNTGPMGEKMVKLLGRDREKVRSQRPLVPGTALVDYSRVPSMTAGYVVSRAGAAKLLAHRQPFGRPIDVDLRFWWECDQLRILGVSPSAIALDDTSEVSSIWDTRDTLTPGQRWRKFTMKLALTLGNAWHRRRLPKL